MSCDEIKILIQKATTATTPRVLAITSAADADSALARSLATITGITTTIINAADNAAAYAAANFSNYDVIIMESIWGGDPEGDPAPGSWIDTINTRSAELIAFYNAGGGIIQQANDGTESVDDYPKWATDYYLALGFQAASVSQTDPRTSTDLGKTWGITDAMADCCKTHNAFIALPPTLLPLEIDANGLAVTVGYLNLEMPSTGIGGNELAIDMTIDIEPGQPVAGANTTVSGAWLKADSAWTVTLKEPAQVMCTSTDSNYGNTNVFGAFLCNFAMPSLAPGTYYLVLEGIASDGSAVTRTATIIVDASGNLVSFTYDRAGAALADTGVTPVQAALYSGVAGLLVALGVGAFMLRRRLA